MSDENKLLPLRDQIFIWLNENQYTKASFDRIISHVTGASTHEQLRDLVNENPDLFRTTIIKGGLEGLALVSERSEPMPTGFQELIQTIEGSITGPMMDHDLIHRTLSDDTPPVYPSSSIWADISTEEYREYVFRNDQTIRIHSPMQLHIGEFVEGRVGGPNHFITAADGLGHHIPAGWLQLSWKTKPGKEIFN